MCRAPTSSSFAVSHDKTSSCVYKSGKTVGNLLTDAHKHIGQTKEGREEFANDVVSMRRQLRTMGQRTIDPQSRFIRYWDLVTVLALLFTAFITPFGRCYRHVRRHHTQPPHCSTMLRAPRLCHACRRPTERRLAMCVRVCVYACACARATDVPQRWRTLRRST